MRSQIVVVITLAAVPSMRGGELAMANRCGNRPSSRYGQLHIWRVDRLSSPSHRMATNPSSPCSGTPEADLWKVHALAVAIALFMFLLSCYLSALNRHHQSADKVTLPHMGVNPTLMLGLPLRSLSKVKVFSRMIMSFVMHNTEKA